MSDRLPDQCLVCRFYKADWFPAEGEPDARPMTAGRCRRRPPVMLAVQSSNEFGVPFTDYVTAWPAVDQSDWCGEFERAEEKFL